MIGEIARGSWGMCKIAPVDAVQALRVPLPQQILQNLPKSPEEGRSRSRSSSFATTSNTSPVTTTTTTTTAAAAATTKKKKNLTTTTTTAGSLNGALGETSVGNRIARAQIDEELTILDESPTMLWSQLQESNRLLFAPVGDMTERVSPPTSDDEDATGRSSDEEENDSDLQEQIRAQRERQKRELLARV